MSGVQRPEWRKGIIRLVTIEPPPPGKDFFIQVPTVPEGIWWRPKSLRFRYVASAAAVSRLVGMGFSTGKDEVDPYLRVITTVSLGNGLTQTFNFFEGAAQNIDLVVAGAGEHNTQFPREYLVQPGHFIRSAINTPDAADQLTNISLVVQEYTYVPPVDFITGEIQTAMGKILAALEKKSCGCPLVATAVGAPTDT